MNINLSEVSKDFDEIDPPRKRDSLVNIPYDSEVFLWKKTYTRWRKTSEGLVRDYSGEADWRDMSKYVSKSYEEVFMETYNRYVK